MKPTRLAAALVTLGLVASPAWAGKKKNKKNKKDAEVPAAEAEAAVTLGDVPDDAKSRAFAETLVSMTIEDFRAVDGAGANVVFSTLDFAPDNSWKAVGYTDFGDEGKMECVESGTWVMEPASSKSEATVIWTVTETDCVGRDSGTETRMAMTISGDDVDVAFR